MEAHSESAFPPLRRPASPINGNAYRSIRKLADETLNDERVVTAENASLLLEAMRQATIADEKEKIQKEFSVQHTEDIQMLTEARRAIRAMDESLRELRAQRDADKQREIRSIQRVLNTTNNQMRFLELGVTVFLLGLGVLAIVEFSTGWLSGSWWWKIITAAAGLAGLYHLIAHLLQKPILGLSSALNRLAKRLVIWRLKKLDLEDRVDLARLDVKGGRISPPPQLLTTKAPPRVDSALTLFEDEN
jgi:hypothetical protein